MDQTESTRSFNHAINDDGDEQDQSNILLKRLSTRTASYFSASKQDDQPLSVDDVSKNNGFYNNLLDQESPKGTT